MTELQSAMLAPLLMLLLLLAVRRWPLAGLPHWSALVYLLPFALACLFVFPSLDDWCYGASGRHGWWAAQREWYSGWSGRITTTAVITGWGNLGAPWFAAAISYRLIIAALFAGTCWALWDLVGAVFPQADRRERRTLALAVAAGWICLLSDPAQGLYWLPGVASYGIGTAAALVACSAVLRGVDGPRWRWWLALVALVVACLASEVVAALALSAIAGLVVVQLRGTDRWRGLTVLAGGLLATAILLLAPGNAVRALVALEAGQLPVDHAPLAVAGDTVWLMWRFINDTSWAPLAALGGWIAWCSPSHRPLNGAVVLLMIPVFILAAALPMAWAGMSPPRAWNPLAISSALFVVIAAWRGGPQLTLPLLLTAGMALINRLPPGLDGLLVPLGTWLAVLAAAWLLLHQLDRQTFAAVLACALLLGSDRFTSAMSQITRGPHYATEQQQRLAILAGAAPGAAVVVPRLTGDLPYLYHVEDLHLSTKSWQNQGCAAFFGLASVRAK